jgi:hypothetical protein
MRSSIHDLANILSGIQGILELSDPDRPLTPRDRARLDAILTDGMATLERSRYLAMGTLPESAIESGADWRRQLKDQLQPLSVVFRSRIDVNYEGDPAQDRWPGELLRGYIAAVSRQILPYVQSAALVIFCEADAKEWRLRWTPASNLPESLQPEATNRPRDISARWALRTGAALGITLVAQDECLLARIPRF